MVCTFLTLNVFATLRGRRSLASGEEASPPWWLPVLFSLQAIALPVSLLVVVLFWALVYPGSPSSKARILFFPLQLFYFLHLLVQDDAINYFVHGANFLAMAVDGFTSRLPYPVAYVFTAYLAFAIIYVLYSITYSQVGGTNENGKPYSATTFSSSHLVESKLLTHG